MEIVNVADGQEFNFFVERFPKWRGWLASLVIDDEGKSFGSSHSSRDISNPIDHQLLLALRSNTDVIFTTGETARRESYKPSRFAPIAVLTHNPDSLANLSLFAKSGQFKNFTLSPPKTFEPMNWCSKELRDMGFETFLFEGGKATLLQLIDSGVRLQIVLNLANSQHPNQVDPRLLLEKALGKQERLKLTGDFMASGNRIFTWSTPAT